MKFKSFQLHVCFSSVVYLYWFKGKIKLQVEQLLQFLILIREVQKCPVNISNRTKSQFSYANYLCIMEMIMPVMECFVSAQMVKCNGQMVKCDGH